MATKLSFPLTKLGKRTSHRRLGPPPERPPSDPAAASFSGGEDPFLAEETKEEAKERVQIEKIQDHLLNKMFRSERVSVAAAPTDAAAAPPTAFRIKLLLQHFTIEGTGLALPYSTQNQRFLQLLESGRLPWDQLRAIPELAAKCEGKYKGGALGVEIEDKRVAEHLHDSGLRHAVVQMDDDALLQDLQEADFNQSMQARARPPFAPAPPKPWAVGVARRPRAGRPSLFFSPAVETRRLSL